MTTTTDRIRSIALALLIVPAAVPGSALATGAQATQPAKLKSMTAGSYQEYSKTAFDSARGSRRILFFHASWCPTCKQADTDLLNNLRRLPANVVVFRTDYDREVALKRQYGIISQHTFVLVDAQGTAVSRWAGGATTEILAHLKK